jgi:hypothetical protein
VVTGQDPESVDASRVLDNIELAIITDVLVLTDPLISSPEIKPQL